MAKKLVLTVDSYDQPQKDDDPSGVRSLKALSRGDSFEPVTDAEYDRLVEIGAAVDPQKQNEDAKAEAEQRIAALEAEKAQLEDQIESAQADADPSSLTKPELVSRLEAAGLDTEGSKAELSARYAAHVETQG